MRVSEILEDAAAIVESGWTQGSPVLDKNNDPIALCVIGAIVYAVQGRRRGIDMWLNDNELYSDLARRAFENHISSQAFRWNDMPGRTKREVVEALRGCAEKEEKKELDTSMSA